MSNEAENPDVTDELVAHQEAPVDTSQQGSDAQDPVVSKSSKDEDQDYNWKKMRRAMEELQHTNRTLENRLEAYEKSDVKDEYDEVDRLAGDELLTKAQTMKLFQKSVEEAAQKFVQKQSLETLDDRIRFKYPDFDQIVTPDCLEELKRDPLCVEALQGLKDPYKQAAFLYSQAKLRGYTPESSLERKQLEKNASKPRSTQSLGGTSPLHDANRFATWPDPDLKRQLWKEMQEAAKGA